MLSAPVRICCFGDSMVNGTRAATSLVGALRVARGSLLCTTWISPLPSPHRGVMIGREMGVAFGCELTSEGDVTHLHVGLKGTMNALFLKDLADKVRRGLRGRVEGGKSGGGNCYGYDVVKKFAADGEPVRGDRAINKFEACVVRRIFSNYASGKSPKRIAFELNKEGIKAPGGADWGFSTINGNRRRGTGILNNEMYVGRIVWNRLRYIKDPDTGKRVSRPNPESEWIFHDVPELRIIEQDLWDRIKARQEAIKVERSTGKPNRLHERQRAKDLFSGLTRCACCGGGYSMISQTLVGCSTARNKST